MGRLAGFRYREIVRRLKQLGRARLSSTTEHLAFREEGVKVTLALSKKSVESFKSEAAKNHTQYKSMIRHLVDAYVDSFAPLLTCRSTPMSRKRAAD